jgi:hypothetical protein
MLALNIPSLFSIPRYTMDMDVIDLRSYSDIEIIVVSDASESDSDSDVEVTSVVLNGEEQPIGQAFINLRGADERIVEMVYPGVIFWGTLVPDEERRSLALDRRLTQRNNRLIERALRGSLPAFIHQHVPLIAGFMHLHDRVRRRG